MATHDPTLPLAAAPPAQRLFTVDQLAAIEPALPPGAIRRDLFQRQTNGLAAANAIVHRGRRLLIDRERYLAWLAETGKEVAA